LNSWDGYSQSVLNKGPVDSHKFPSYPYEYMHWSQTLVMFKLFAIRQLRLPTAVPLKVIRFCSILPTKLF